mgnify:CR=1 FL=1
MHGRVVQYRHVDSLFFVRGIPRSLVPLCTLATRGDCGGEGDGAMRSEAIGAALSLALGLGNLGGFLRLVEMLLQDSVQGVGLHRGRCKKMVDFIFAASLSQYEQTRDR